MELKLAKKELEDEQQTISLKEIQNQVETNGSATFYLDNDNPIKDIQKMRATLDKNLKSVHLNELRYGIDKNSFLYELHIINY
ncbi:HP0268 family nuclease [Helicobacter sp. MIT 14-3879]|uniref:HP0268 family nuclease n=1 Tax=Helicobacter sp. MIT 14-3879 TaxID=2040649 RepID=UPI000E1E7C6F|nr:HP0268 family nuclease [Helicobacter sp. MIT 14-3879]RDU64179.1 hypothetical protein CQA44_04445 [Helicobacter sp. MIT 14-3879]